METSSRTCRCCMESKSVMDMTNILEANFNGLQLSISYFNCTGIQILADEPFPLDTCNHCVRQLRNFQEFREICIKSDGFYRGQSMHLKREPSLEEFDETKLGLAFADALEPSCKVEKDDKIDPVKDEVQGSNDESTHRDSSESSDDAFAIPVRTRTRKATSKRSSNKTKSDKTKPKATSEKTKVFTCTVGTCSKRFYVQRIYEGHVRQHQGLKPASCTHCSKQFSKWIALDQHIDAEHSNRTPDIACDYPNCTKTFTTVVYKKRHIKAVHKPRSKPVHTDLAYTCHECGKSFVALPRLKEHLFTHLPNSEKPHQCSKCDKGFYSKHRLKDHMLHHEGVKNFVCPHCGMRKTTKRALRKHVNSHTKEKPSFSCVHCEKTFSTNDSARRHTRVVHEGIRAFHCTYCDLSFGKAETLKHHIRTHTGEKPHKCTLCERAFIQPTALKTHMATHLR